MKPFERICVVFLFGDRSVPRKAGAEIERKRIEDRAVAQLSVIHEPADVLRCKVLHVVENRIEKRHRIRDVVPLKRVIPYIDVRAHLRPLLEQAVHFEVAGAVFVIDMMCVAVEVTV